MFLQLFHKRIEKREDYLRILLSLFGGVYEPNTIAAHGRFAKPDRSIDVFTLSLHQVLLFYNGVSFFGCVNCVAGKQNTCVCAYTDFQTAFWNAKYV
jgi:hypothetical protein